MMVVARIRQTANCDIALYVMDDGEREREQERKTSEQPIKY